MKVIFKYWGLYVVVLCLYGTNLCYFFIESDALACVIGPADGASPRTVNHSKNVAQL